MHNDAQITQINRIAKAFPNPEMEKLDSIARHAGQMIQQFNGQVFLLQSALSDTTGHAALRPDQITWLEANAALLRDSLVLLADNDPAFESAFPDLLLSEAYMPENRLGSLLTSARQDEAILVLENMMLRAQAAESAFLYSLSSRFTVLDIDWDKYEPMVIAQKSGIRAGEYYEAEVFLTAPYREPDYISIKVNGEEQKVSDGTSYFRHRYTEPGEKKNIVTIIRTNPLTLQQKAYVKEFTAQVLPAAPN